MTPTPKRSDKLDVVFSADEIERVRASAKTSGVPLSHYVRRRLRLPIPRMGRPKKAASV